MQFLSTKAGWTHFYEKAPSIVKSTIIFSPPACNNGLNFSNLRVRPRCPRCRWCPPRRRPRRPPCRWSCGRRRRWPRARRAGPPRWRGLHCWLHCRWFPEGEREERRKLSDWYDDKSICYNVMLSSRSANVSLRGCVNPASQEEKLSTSVYLFLHFLLNSCERKTNCQSSKESMIKSSFCMMKSEWEWFYPTRLCILYKASDLCERNRQLAKKDYRHCYVLMNSTQSSFTHCMIKGYLYTPRDVKIPFSKRFVYLTINPHVVYVV